MHKSLIENANAMAFAKVGMPSTAANGNAPIAIGVATPIAIHLKFLILFNSLPSFRCAALYRMNGS